MSARAGAGHLLGTPGEPRGLGHGADGADFWGREEWVSQGSLCGSNIGVASAISSAFSLSIAANFGLIDWSIRCISIDIASAKGGAFFLISAAPAPASCRTQGFRPVLVESAHPGRFGLLRAAWRPS